MTRRPKVLVVAYACNPHHGSEEGVGWGWVRMISGIADAVVITADFHRRDIERAGSLRGIRFVYAPSRLWHYRPTPRWRRIEGSVLKPIMNLAYSAWQAEAFDLARRLHAEEAFDLVHLLTYVGFRFPGRFHEIDAPFVWGPIGGLENTPWRFLPELGPGGAVYYAGRNVINTLQKRFLPGPKRAFGKATGGIIAATEGIRREIRTHYGHDSEVICEVGPPEQVARDFDLRRPDEPLRLVWSGLHLPGKALPLLLRALAKLGPKVDWRLAILGEGPCTARWRRLAGRLGLAPRCDWLGWLRREAALEQIRRSHLLVVTSLKDLTSTVLLEALSSGVPVLCPDHCGFTNVVTPSCGVRIPISSPRQLEEDLAREIGALERDEGRRRRLAAGATRRVRDLGWAAKRERLSMIYARKVRASGPIELATCDPNTGPAQRRVRLA
jgi:glycosyltransferase involved in cell wall biosynthesis